MLKRLYNKKYMSIAMHSLLGLCVLILLAALVFRFPDIKAAVDSFLSALRPIIFALVLSYFCNPLMNLAERYVFGWLDRFPRFPKKKRILSLLLSYLLILAVIASLVLITVPEVINNYESLINNLTEFVLIGVEWVDSILNLANIDSISQLIVDNSHRILEAAALFLTDAIVSLSGFTMTVILAGTLSFFMLLYREVWTAGLRRIALALMPRKLYAEINDTLIFANRTFGRYLLGSVFDSVLVGCETFLLMAIFGVPYAGLVSVVVGTTNIIPYFGPFIGAIPSFFIILTEDAFKAILFLVLVFVVQQIDGNIINPRIVGKTTSINSMWVILAITVIGGWLGIIGMVIAIPLFSVIYMLVSRFATARLKKRGLPTDHEAYAGTFSIAHPEDPTPQKAAEAEKPTAETETTEGKEDAE